MKISEEAIYADGRAKTARTKRAAYETTEELEAVLNRYVPEGEKSQFIRKAIAAALADMLPAEPLIKDEKIRKAVRAWWDCCQEGIKDKRIYIKDAEFRMGIYRLDLGRYYFFDDKKEGFYTIAELCGEEEE